MRHTLIAAALALAPLAAVAEDIRYTFLDVRLFSTDSDAVSTDVQGGAVNGSYAINDYLQLGGRAQYGRSENVTVGTSSGNFRQLGAALRLGARYPITPGLHAVVEAGPQYAQVEGSGAFDGTSEDGFGYIAEAGLRATLTPMVELGAFYSHQDAKDVIDTLGSFAVDVQFHLNPQFSLVAGATNSRGIDSYAAGARYHF
jgi:hypothetical protein